MKTPFEKMRQGRARCEAAQRRQAAPAALVSMEALLGRPLTYEEKLRFNLDGWISITTESENFGAKTRLPSPPWYRRLWGHFFDPDDGMTIW